MTKSTKSELIRAPLEKFETAYSNISKIINVSPLIYSTWLSNSLEAEIYLKLECLQPGKSFKIRGAINTLYSSINKPSKVFTASGGNHGLAVTLASKYLNIPTVVIVPSNTSQNRINLLKNLGAEVQVQGKTWDEANLFGKNLSEKSPNNLYIHPFDDDLVRYGQGTIALELRDQLPDIDAVFASVGGGGLLTGISLALESLGLLPKVKIYAVETKGTDSLDQSLKMNKLAELPAITSIATSLGAKKISQYNFDVLKRLLTKNFVIEDKDAIKSLIDFIDMEKIIIEPATSCIISALFQNKNIIKGKKVAVIVCGSNVTIDDINLWKKQFLN
ncbi:MAG: threonine/serine dehydratase [Candidatus Thorarchaeota archaeon]